MPLCGHRHTAQHKLSLLTKRGGGGWVYWYNRINTWDRCQHSSISEGSHLFISLPCRAMLAEMLVHTSPVVAWFFSLKGLCWWEAGRPRDLAWIPPLHPQNSSRGRGETNKWGVSLRYWSPDKSTHRLKWCESRLLLSLWYYLSYVVLITAGAEPCKFGLQWEKRDIVWFQLSGAILKFILAPRLQWLFQACW